MLGIKSRRIEKRKLGPLAVGVGLAGPGRLGPWGGAAPASEWRGGGRQASAAPPRAQGRAERRRHASCQLAQLSSASSASPFPAAEKPPLPSQHPLLEATFVRSPFTHYLIDIDYRGGPSLIDRSAPLRRAYNSRSYSTDHRPEEPQWPTTNRWRRMSNLALTTPRPPR